MIYKKSFKAKCLIILFSIFIAQLSCIQNPVRHDLEGEQTEKQSIPQRAFVSSIVQDKNGVLWGFRDDSVYILNGKSSTLGITVNLDKYSRISDLLLDRQGSVLILYENILGRISLKQGNYIVDTLKVLSLSGIFEKKTTDYSGNVWFYDRDFGDASLIKWDGIQITDYMLNHYEEPDSFLYSGFIAGGDSCVYLLSKDTAGSIVVDKFIEGDSTLNRNSYTIGPIPFTVQQVFALNSKLDIIIETYNKIISDGNVATKSEHVLLEIDENQIRERQQLPVYYWGVETRSGPDEVYFYNYCLLSKITSTSVTEKRTSIDCSNLFIDTSGAVKLYSNSTGKTINISNLPGFQ